MILYTASVTSCILIHPRTDIQSKVPERLSPVMKLIIKRLTTNIYRESLKLTLLKSPNPDSNEAYGEFMYNQTANAMALDLF